MVANGASRVARVGKGRWWKENTMREMRDVKRGTRNLNHAMRNAKFEVRGK